MGKRAQEGGDDRRRLVRALAAGFTLLVWCRRAGFKAISSQSYTKLQTYAMIMIIMVILPDLGGRDGHKAVFPQDRPNLWNLYCRDAHVLETSDLMICQSPGLDILNPKPASLQLPR